MIFAKLFEKIFNKDRLLKFKSFFNPILVFLRLIQNFSNWVIVFFTAIVVIFFVYHRYGEVIEVISNKEKFKLENLAGLGFVEDENFTNEVKQYQEPVDSVNMIEAEVVD